MNIFFCDIAGTFSGNNGDRENALKTLANNLDNLMEVDNLDNLFFSFISTNHMDDVKKCMLELQNFIKDKRVKLGAQFSGNHIFINGEIKRYTSCKLSQMLQFLKENKIDHVYYADDSLTNHKLFEHVMIKAHPEIQIQSFVLGTLKESDCSIGIEEKEINGLNNLLNLYNNRKKDKQNYRHL